MDKLGTLGVFIGVAECGSFVAAAHRLGLSGSAVGKAISRLEDEMGVRLFHRCLPPFAVASELAEGKLVSLLEDYMAETGTFRVLWPTNRYLSLKVRAFVDYMAGELFKA
jgi:DNA-binding transcriptional LysR family regulator